MNRRVAGWILGVALLLVLGGAGWWWQFGRFSGRGGARGHRQPDAAAAPTENRTFDLYFPSNGGGLQAERRQLAVTEDPKNRIRAVVEALLAGPAGTPLASPPAAKAPAKPAGAPVSQLGLVKPGPASGGPSGPTEAPARVRPLPPEVKLGGVELSADGVAYLDLRWAEHEDPPESGSTEEIQRVYSIIDTVALNVPQVNRVVLLWNGTQRLTFSGHLDTSRPLEPDRTLLTP
jgi:sporulation and spore germination protein